MAFDVENLFQAVDIIVGQRLQDVSFDKTIICTIVDDSKKKNGCYVVTDGTIKFNAYVNDATYRNNDQVRVSILGGDFGEKKFIVGKYTGDEDSAPITYESPLASIVPITGNLVTETQHSRNGYNSLCANKNDTDADVCKEIWRLDLASNPSFKELQANGIYNTISMKAEFKTALQDYDIIQGNYGLLLGLFIQPSMDSTTKIQKYIALDSSEMIGNPYSFLVYSTQAKKADIVSTGIITEMVLWIYQGGKVEGGSRFICRNGNEVKEVPVKRDSAGNAIDNIFIRNIEIGFGSDITKVEDNTLEIFTSSTPYYKYKDATEATNKKDIELLWFNKTEDNEFLGFRDGLFDLAYDEIEYLKLANQDSRLLAQIGRTDVPSDEPGLKLAADLKDAKPIMIKGRDALTKDLNEILSSLARQTVSSNAITQRLNNLLDTTTGQLVVQWENANTAIEKWNSAYIGVLQYAYDKQNEVESPSEWNSDWKTDYFQNYTKAINSALKSVNDFFVWLDENTQPSAPQSAHRGNYDLYWYRMSNKIIEIQAIVAKLEAMLNGNHARLQAYKSGTYIFYEYKQKDFSSYANKYCIYWYRYNKDYKLEYVSGADNTEYTYGKFLSDGWQRMDIADQNGNILKNFGLPRDSDLCVDENGNPVDPNDKNVKKYYPPKALSQVLSREMDINLLEEKYMAILFYNHEMFKSNVLIFTNSEPELIPSESLADQRDALKIEHDVDSYEHYQSYDEFNQLKNLDDGGKVRQLKCSYDGLFRGDEALIDAGLYWYIPNHNTMLTFDTDFLKKEGFATDATEKTDYSMEGYTYFYKKVGVCAEADKPTGSDGEKYDTSESADRYFFYKIKQTLEKTATNNTIIVKALLKDVDYPVQGEITMTFSTFGTNGTKYTLTLVPSTSQAAVIGKDKPLKLQLLLRDSQNNTIDIVDSNVVPPSGEENSEKYAYGFSVSSWNNLPNAFTITNIFGEEENSKNIKGLTAALNGETIETWKKDTPYFGIINAKVNFRLPKKDHDSQESLENQDENAIKEIEQYQKYRIVDLNTLYAIPYSASDAYYISGATNIVYNNQGTVSFVSEDEYKLYKVNDKGNTPVSDQSWHIEYYNKKGEWINESHKDWNMLINYMPVLNSKNRLTPAPLYIKNLEYIPVVICTVDGDIAWVQPIIITQNAYASSTLNDWNGSLTIDKKNGTILSTAVGAGKKESDNSFSGVLMGDIAKGANFDPDNISGLGLYGFNYGAQSFCLSVDGKAFFGKAGRGRIYIDGDNGTISSASFQQNRNYDKDGNYMGDATAGMMIDLDDGFIHMRGTKVNANSGKYEADTVQDKDENGNDITAQAEILITTGETELDKDGKVTKNVGYFKIRSAKQFNPEHYLIYVGSEKYYLQTDNYKSVLYSFDEGAEVDISAAGTHLDLVDGYLDAYNFTLSSKNIFINSADKNSPYFVVRDIQTKDGKQIGVNLLYAGADEYYLKSNDFKSTNNAANTQGKGIKINLKEYGGAPAGIEAYNFDLRAGQVADELTDYNIILSDSGNPYLQINTAVTKGEGETKTVEVVPLVLISRDKQEFQSSDYAEPNSKDGIPGTGIKLSLSDQYLKAYSGFTLQAYQTGVDGTPMPNYILISSSGTYPFYVRGNDVKDDDGNVTGHYHFGVGWNGQVTAQGGTFTNINAVGGNFSGNITVNGSMTGGDIIGANIYGPTKNSPTFKLNGGTGHLTCTSATIGGWDVSASGLSSPSGSMSFSPSGGISSDYFNSTIEGVTEIKDLKVLNSLTTSGTCQVYIDGNCGIGVQADKAYDLKTGGDIYLGGIVYVGGTSTYFQNYSNGLWMYGNVVSIETTKFQVGANDSSTTTILNGSKVYIGAPTFQIGADTAVTATSIYGTLSISENTTIRTATEGDMTLKQYVGVTHVGGVDAASLALALVSSSGDVTLNAPSSTASAANQVLCSTNAGAACSWKTLGATLTNFSNTTVALSDADSGVYEVTLEADGTATTYNAYETIYLYTSTLPESKGRFSTSESYYEPSSSYYWTRCTLPKRITLTAYPKTQTGKVQVKVSIK